MCQKININYSIYQDFNIKIKNKQDYKKKEGIQKKI